MELEVEEGMVVGKWEIKRGCDCGCVGGLMCVGGWMCVGVGVGVAVCVCVCGCGLVDIIVGWCR